MVLSWSRVKVNISPEDTKAYIIKSDNSIAV